VNPLPVTAIAHAIAGVPISDVVLLALITAVPILISGAIVAPLTIIINNRSVARAKRMEAETSRAEKVADWARQDLVAERLEKQQIQTAIKVEEVARISAVTSQITDKKLDEIHGAVNSNFTAIKKALLRATERELVLLIHIAGDKPTKDQKVEIEATRKQINELKAEIDIEDTKLRNMKGAV